MIILAVAVALFVFAIILGAWWYLFFGRANPPLPRASVSVARSASSSVAATPSSTSGSAPSASTDIPGENPPLGAEPLNIDGVAFSVEIASTALEQTRGLSFRSALGENDGMLFLFGTGTIQTFWMKDMRFPLDMIWISGNTVVGFAQDVPAPAPGTPLWQLPIYASPDLTDKVLEVNAGIVARYHIKVGDMVTIGAAR